MVKLRGAHTLSILGREWWNVNASTHSVSVRVKVSDSIYPVCKAQSTIITLMYSYSAAIFHTSSVANFCILHFTRDRTTLLSLAESCYISLSQCCCYYIVAFTKVRFVVHTMNYVSI